MRNIPREPPTEKVEDMKIEGLSDDDIIKALRGDHSNQEINDAMNQSEQEVPEDNVLEEMDNVQNDKDNEPEELLGSAPSPDEQGGLDEVEAEDNYPRAFQQNISSDQTQSIVEAIVEEKWEDFISRVGDLGLWKESINNDIEAIKQEILRVQERMNNLQNVMVGKVTEYSRSIGDINTEMKALEQVFQRILQPLTTNIKDLNKVTAELKSHKNSHSKKKTVKKK